MSRAQEKSAQTHIYPPHVKEKALALIRAGYECVHVAEAVDVNITTVRNWATKNGINLRGPRTFEKPKGKNLAPAPYRRGYVWGAGE